jgi:hypothetical protein
LWAYFVHDPTQNGANDGSFDGLQSGGTRQGGFAPAHFVRKDGDVKAQCLGEEGSQQKLNATGCTHHTPTVKNFHAAE